MNENPVPYVVAADRPVPRWPLIAAGVLVIIVGLGFLVWPFFAASWLLVILFGSALIANGIALLTRAVGSPVALIGGLLLVGAGILSIVFSELTVGALVAFVGVSLIFFGAIWVIVGARLASRAAAAIVPGVLILLSGIVALVFPGIALSVVAVIGGICLVLLGAFIIWLARRLGNPNASATTIII